MIILMEILEKENEALSFNTTFHLLSGFYTTVEQLRKEKDE